MPARQNRLESEERESKEGKYDSKREKRREDPKKKRECDQDRIS